MKTEGWLMLHNVFPILEFDEDRDAFIRPERHIKPLDISERAVLCFFSDAIKKLLAKYPHKIVTHLKGEGLTFPVYELDYKDKPIVLVQAIVGAPWAAGHIEELTAYGCRKFIACGGCGVLQKDIAVGHLIIPVSAVRDEGTSYHYLPPSREVNMNKHAVKVIENTLTESNVPYIKGKTWTTDAFFRETPAKVKHRREEGCIAVDMEASAFIAVAEYNNVTFGQIFYAGDNLGGEEWDNRGWQSRDDIREWVLTLSIEACLNL
jgi:uridine phosphorylase